MDAAKETNFKKKTVKDLEQFDKLEQKVYNNLNYNLKWCINNHSLPLHLCLNTKTALEHMENDSSYTILSVPDQTKSATCTGHTNIGKFELVTSKNKIPAIPLNPGKIFTYLGYMFTHWQQIKNESNEIEQLVP